MTRILKISRFEVPISRFFWTCFQNLQICMWQGLEGLFTSHNIFGSWQLKQFFCLVTFNTEVHSSAVNKLRYNCLLSVYLSRPHYAILFDNVSNVFRLQCARGIGKWNNHHVIKTMIILTTLKRKASVFKLDSSGLKRVFEKLRFRDGLVWMVDTNFKFLLRSVE